MGPSKDWYHYNHYSFLKPNYDNVSGATWMCMHILVAMATRVRFAQHHGYHLCTAIVVATRRRGLWPVQLLLLSLSSLSGFISDLKTHTYAGTPTLATVCNHASKSQGLLLRWINNGSRIGGDSMLMFGVRLRSGNNMRLGLRGVVASCRCVVAAAVVVLLHCRWIKRKMCIWCISRGGSPTWRG